MHECLPIADAMFICRYCCQTPHHLATCRGEIVHSLAGDSLKQSRMFHLLDDAVSKEGGVCCCTSFAAHRQLGRLLAAPLPRSVLPAALQMRAQLAAMAVPIRLVAGHDLFREADDADSFFVLQEGGLEWMMFAGFEH